MFFIFVLCIECFNAVFFFIFFVPKSFPKTTLNLNKRLLMIVNFLKWAIAGFILFICVFSTVNSTHVHYKILLMTGFELGTSDIGSDRSTI